MPQADDPLAAFVAAFNARDLDALRALLAEDATAQVLGAPFPEERGAAAIATTSLPHLLEPDADLGAALAEHDGRRLVLLRRDRGAGPLDTVVEASVSGGRVRRLAYTVAPFRPDELAALGDALGIPTV